jgi:hypothetical protein
MHDLEAGGEPRFVGEHQDFAGIRRMCLVEQLHIRMLPAGPCSLAAIAAGRQVFFSAFTG